MTGKRTSNLVYPIGHLQIGEKATFPIDRMRATCSLVSYYRRTWSMQFAVTHRSNGTTVRRIA